MKKFKILMATMIFSSLSYSKDSFSTYADMCEVSDSQNCANNKDEVKNLQVALNSDNTLGLQLTTDGKWGDKTKEAVQKFQKKQHITPSEGYVGVKTKAALSKVFKNLDLPKVAHNNNSTSKCYADFKRKTNLKSSFKVFKDKKLLAKANEKNTHLKVDVKTQRIKLFVDGKVALSSPCTTGAKRKFEPNTKIYRDKRTPKGTFKITEKISDKRSSIFGKYYRKGKVVYKGDKRKYRGSKKGLKYKGASLKHWMRLTSSGIGLHASKYVKRHPGTNGCIRLPFKVAKTIFAKVKTGTKVSIIN
jgi:lipoprotein-anchoring transpeptidase ErfK/SrfK